MADQFYTVRPGDSLWKIAARFRMDVSELIAANPKITNPALIFPNQVITIPQQDMEEGALVNRVVELVNNERAKIGLDPLTLNWELSRIARYKSEDMYSNSYFSHQSPVYGSPFDMMKRFGVSYSAAAENIARGQTTAEGVMNSWMNSSGHRANILNSNFTQIGVGYVNHGTPYWTQMFIRP